MSQIHLGEPCKRKIGARGWVEGVTITSTATKAPIYDYFGGLQYAQAPVGDLRFQKTRQLPPDFSYGTEASPRKARPGTKVCPQPDWLTESDRSEWDEDCLQLNIWLPSGSDNASTGPLPVLFYIHGGFLQFGTAQKPHEAMAGMMEETPFKYVVVSAAYRVNAFGFLSSEELQAEAESNGHSAGNMGFWDQRAALEWTAANIECFGGDPKKITVAGYSAGSHSTFHQLAHDLFRPEPERIIYRAIMWSNGTGVQPKPLSEHQKAFDELVSVLEIPAATPPAEKLARLRALPANQIADALKHLKYSEFRGFCEGDFISKQLIHNINSGEFGRRMKERDLRLLMGECRDEHNLYRAWRTPSNSYDALFQRLEADYPETAVRSVMELYCPAEQVPSQYVDWVDLFGRIYADLQVHCLERGFVNCLDKSGLVVGADVLRYRIEWRAKCVDDAYPPEWLVTHDTDNAMWFWGNGWGDGLTDEEKKIASPINQLFADFVGGKDIQWPKKGPKVVRRLNDKGSMDLWEDELWDHGLSVWNAVNS